MSVLIFGETGQVAREIARLAGPDGSHGVGQPGIGDPGIGDLRLGNFRFLGRQAADLADPAACAAAIRAQRPALVINAAAHTAVDRAETEEALATTVNGDAPAAMAQAAADLGIPLVHVSTDYVFDGSGTTPWQPGDPLAPLGAYGRSKLAGEVGVRDAGGVHAILRTSWVFSAHGSNFVKTMLRLGATRQGLSVVADQIGGPTPAAAIAAAVLTIGRALTERPDASGTYHFAGTPDASWADFAREIFLQAGLAVEVTGIPTADYPTPARRPQNSRLDCTSLTDTFGIPRPDWRAGVADVLRDLASAASTTL